MPEDFYDKVASKFGNYQTTAKYIKDITDQDPEEVFLDQLVKVSGTNKIACDIGCADGRFTLKLAPNFKKIVGIDTSIGMLEAAARNLAKSKVTNVEFQKDDANHSNINNSFFDVIYSRRGPTPFAEFHRLLKPEGYIVIIGIGEKDCQDIKNIFGRGQGYGQANNSKLELNSKIMEQTGFIMTFAKEYYYDEYYPSYQELDLFLQGVPIFEDYDSVKDKRYLSKYVAKFHTDKGVKLPRHRIVMVGKKM